MENKELREILDNHHMIVTDDLARQAIAAINQHIYKEVVGLLPEKKASIDAYRPTGYNEALNDIRAAARRRFLDE